MTLRYTKRALADLNRILSYVSQRSPQGASRLADHIGAAVHQIAEHPQSGRTTSRPNVRVKVVSDYPYLIFYRIVGQAMVSIVHIRHAARRPFAR
jgi:addiction module RelE/StbE family toxin